MSLLHRKAVHEEHRVESTGTTVMKSEQTGLRSAPANGPRRRSSGLKFFAPSTTTKPEAARDSHKAWEAAYLKDLRINRPARPGGSRPLPGRASTTVPEPYARASSAMSFRPSCSTRQPELSADRSNERCASAMSHRRAQSDMPTADLHVGGIGSPLAPQLAGSAMLGDSSGAHMASESPQAAPEIAYRESGMRWMEKQEARSLREALEDMDVRDEAKIHAAAQAEASELVLKHRSQGLPYRNPDRAYNYKQHLEKGAHARSQSLGWNVGPAGATNGHVPGQRSSSDGSNSSRGDSNPSQDSQTTSNSTAGSAFTSDGTQNGRERVHALSNWPQRKAYMGLAFSESPTIRSGRRRSSGPRARDVSGGLFRNPDDKIYEEPDEMKVESPLIKSEESKIPAPLAMKTRNTVATTTQPSFRPRVAFADEKQRLYRSEIHRNPPSQSRDPSYKRNGPPDTPPDPALGTRGDVPSDRPATRDGKEIRSDDIRTATSMRRKDRSPKLPSPTVVSDRPERPIVSFDRNWVPHDTDKQAEPEQDQQSVIPARPRFKPRMPESTVSAPVVPIINVPDAPSIQINDVPEGDSNPIPSISVSEAPVPTISLPDHPSKTRPSRDPVNWSRPSPANRPLPYHSATTPVHSSKLHWTPSSRRATAQCAACALPIEGRIVSAASQRFHPHCFTCHHCSEALECVAFYPEPDSARDARLARIDARANGTELPEDRPGETAADDGDASLRFYCHLDYHEFFSPRCRSCKTPIETEVVLACGGSWHVGHFFCAECGDPFDAKTPFVERDGYAWCVGCHAVRFSGKCRGCRKPVVDGGVSALGGEWHLECFCCVVSRILSLKARRWMY